MKPLLLIADSDAEACDRYQQFLSEHGYEVETASDGLDCLEKLRQLRPAALVLDRELRWGGGDGVLAWLREEQAVSGVAVVLTATADSLPEVAEDTRLPPVKVLPRPFAPTTLLKTVREAILQLGQEEPLNRNRVAAGSELFIG
jgi:DNA-binding response OmpR family regulator